MNALGSESASSSGVSISELLNCEMVWKTVFIEVLSESMLGEFLVYDGSEQGGKSKIGKIWK